MKLQAHTGSQSIGENRSLPLVNNKIADTNEAPPFPLLCAMVSVCSWVGWGGVLRAERN